MTDTVVKSTEDSKTSVIVETDSDAKLRETKLQESSRRERIEGYLALLPDVDDVTERRIKLLRLGQKHILLQRVFFGLAIVALIHSIVVKDTPSYDWIYYSLIAITLSLIILSKPHISLFRAKDIYETVFKLSQIPKVDKYFPDPANDLKLVGDKPTGAKLTFLEILTKAFGSFAILLLPTSWVLGLGHQEYSDWAAGLGGLSLLISVNLAIRAEGWRLKLVRISDGKKTTFDKFIPPMLLKDFEEARQKEFSDRATERKAGIEARAEGVYADPNAKLETEEKNNTEKTDLRVIDGAYTGKKINNEPLNHDVKSSESKDSNEDSDKMAA